MSAATNSRKRTVRIEVGADARSYVSGGQRVTLVPLTIKRRQNRKLLIPPAPDAATAAGGFDVPMIKGGVVRDGDDRCQNIPCRVLPGFGLQFQLWSGQRCGQRA